MNAGAAGCPGSGMRDRFRGVMLGSMIGDALGMPLEGSAPPPAGSAEPADRLFERVRAA